jgi:hypothetical protein
MRLKKGGYVPLQTSEKEMRKGMTDTASACQESPSAGQAEIY